MAAPYGRNRAGGTWTAKHDQRARDAGHEHYLAWIEYCETHRLKDGEWIEREQRRTICAGWSPQLRRPCCQYPHPHGAGRCHQHRGKAVVAVDHPDFVHGIYSRYLPARYQERFTELGKLQNADVSEELKLARLRQQDYVKALREIEGDGLGAATGKNPADVLAEVVSLQIVIKKATIDGDGAALVKAIDRLEVVASSGVAAAAIWQDILTTSEHIARLVGAQTQLLKVHGEFMHRREVLTLIAGVGQAINELVASEDERRAIRDRLRDSMERV